MKNKKTKIIILISILIVLLTLLIVLLMQSKSNKISQLEQDFAKAIVYTKIKDQELDITNLIETNPIPTISAGMIPIKKDGDNWIITTTDNWYEYTNKEPAYMMLNDGKYQSEEYYNMPKDKSLAKDNINAQVSEQDLGSIYVWIPRFAYDKSKNIIYLKEQCVVSGTYTMPDLFTYELDGKYFSLSGVWVEYNTINVTDISKTNNALSQKVTALNKGETDTIFGFLANTKADSVAKLVSNNNSISVDTDTTNARTNAIQIFDENFNKTSIDDSTNSYRTMLQIVDTSKTEPITNVTATYDVNTGKITVNVESTKNQISKILDENGKELTYENAEKTIANTGDDLIGNGVYYFYIIDSIGNISRASCKVTESNVYMIKDRDSLVLFRDAVNSGTTNAIGIQIADVTDLNEGKYTIDSETGDITFDSNAEQWTPIGTEKNKFKGNYYGNGYTINGIYNNNAYDYTGLFGYVTGSNVIIEGINVQNTYIRGGSYTAGIISYVYYANNLTIQNCSFNGKISGGGYTAGIIGAVDFNGTLDINNCTSNGKISGGVHTGGIVGSASKNSNVTSMTITNCKNYANVTGGEYCGGVCGFFNSNNVNESKIEYCGNYGNISSGSRELGGVVGYASEVKEVTKCYNSGNINSSDIYVGGILGANGNYISLKISECYNTGKIIGNQDVGGIVGIDNSRAKETSYITNCYNVAEIISNKNDAGGIIGYSYKTECSYCYNIGNVTGEAFVGGIFSYSANNCKNIYNIGDITSTAVWTSSASCSDVGGISGATRGKVSYGYNTGNISGKVSFVGGISGQNMNNWGSFENCGYLSGTASFAIGADHTTTGGSDSGSTKYSTIEEMPSIISVVNQENKFVEDTEGINNGYPILAWQVE